MAIGASLLLRTGHRFCVGLAPSIGQALAQRLDEGGRQHPVCGAGQVAADRRTQVRPRPDEIIGFRQDDPGTIGVQPEASFCGERDFQGVRRIGGLGMSDWQDADDGRVALGQQHKHNRAGAILRPFFYALALETNPIPIKKALESMGFEVGSCREPLISEISPEIYQPYFESITQYNPQ